MSRQSRNNIPLTSFIGPSIYCGQVNMLANNIPSMVIGSNSGSSSNNAVNMAFFNKLNQVLNPYLGES